MPPGIPGRFSIGDAGTERDVVEIARHELAKLHTTLELLRVFRVTIYSHLPLPFLREEGHANIEEEFGITLLSREPYLPGTVALIKSMGKVESRYPLEVVVSDQVSEQTRRTILDTASQFGLVGC